MLPVCLHPFTLTFTASHQAGMTTHACSHTEDASGASSGFGVFLKDTSSYGMQNLAQRHSMLGSWMEPVSVDFLKTCSTK